MTGRPSLAAPPRREATKVGVGEHRADGGRAAFPPACSGPPGRLPHRLLLLSQLLLVAPHVVLEFCSQLLVNCEEVLDFISIILHHLLEWTMASLSIP